MSVTHTFVSAVADDNSPTGAVGPDEWNDDHVVDISFEELNDTPAYSGNAGKYLKVNTSENGISYATSASDVGSGFADLRPATPNAMDDEFDDTTGMSGSNNGLSSIWTQRNTATLSYPATSWFRAVAATGNAWGIDQAKPSAQDYTVACRMSGDGRVGTSNSFWGLYLYDATNGDLYAIYYLVGNNNTRVGDIEVSKWGNSGTFFGGAFTNLKALTSAPPPNAFRLVYTNSSTAIDFEVSYDAGLTWINIWSESSDLIGHTRVGIFKTRTGGGNTLNIDWFRRTV